MTHIKSKLDDHRQEVDTTIDLDAIDLRRLVDLPVARIDFVQGGRRVTVAIKLHQSCMKASPTITMSVCNRSAWVTRTAQIRPWVDMAETGEL